MSRPVNEVTLQNLVNALPEMIALGQRCSQEEITFGPACSALINTATRIGLEATALQILQQRDFRLNGSGLRLGYNESEETLRVLDYDQYSHYPKTGPALNAVLQQYHLQPKPESRLKELLVKNSA